MKYILVTGAMGQLGQSIRKIADEHDSLGFVFKNSKELDITNKVEVNTIFGSNSFDFCINCAAYTDVEQAEKNPAPAFAINAKGVKNLAKACKSNNVVLLHISTDYVFDGTKQEPYLRDDRPNPINEYGKSKLLGEIYIKELLEKYYIVRTSWLYSEFGKNFYMTILKKAKTEKTLYISDNQIGCPTSAHNLARSLLEIILKQNIPYGVYHFTDQKVMTWYGFAKMILKENGLESTVNLKKVKNYRTFARRPKYSVLN